MRQFTAFGYYLIAFTVVFIVAQLGWHWFQGGINAHHLLANPDLPSVSDAWGLIILPGLAWLAARRLQYTTNQTVFWYSLVLGFCYGGLLALLYLNGVKQPVALLFFGTYLLALLLPLHRPEVVLGSKSGFWRCIATDDVEPCHFDCLVGKPGATVVPAA